MKGEERGKLRKPGRNEECRGRKEKEKYYEKNTMWTTDQDLLLPTGIIRNRTQKYLESSATILYFFPFSKV